MFGWDVLFYLHRVDSIICFFAFILLILFKILKSAAWLIPQFGIYLIEEKITIEKTDVPIHQFMKPDVPFLAWECY